MSSNKLLYFFIKIVTRQLPKTFFSNYISIIVVNRAHDYLIDTPLIQNSKD